ncbi:MAG TPA: outer membrane beta-barrel protein [Roseiarcus sp.]|nr:outer membrane beta-barrel protein [Roseiarcus sp.]
MSLRKTPLWRRWRPLIATLALSLALTAAPVRGQEDGSSFQLRGDEASPASPFNLDENGGVPPAPPLAFEGATGKPVNGGEEDLKAGKKKAKRTKRAHGGLPQLKPYPGADRAGAPGGAPSVDPTNIPPSTVAALPVPPPKPKRKPDDKPFDPVGVMVGDLRLTPYVEEDLGYSSNPNFTPGPTRGSFFETTDVGLGLQSDWATNDLHAALHGGYTDFFTAPEANSPNAAGTIDGRLDVSREASLDAEGRFVVASQVPGSVTLPTGVVLASTQRPLYEVYGGTVGGVQKFGDFGLALHASLDRTTYQNAELADGQVDDLASDDFDDWGLRGRLFYQISPVVAPFVEGVVDRRIYDSIIDSNGYARDSVGALARAGVTLALTRQITGEISGGYGERQYQDPRLPPLEAPLFDASLIWSITPLSTATFKAVTTLADTTTPGASGAVARIYSIDLAHALLRNLTLDATVSVERDYYVGIPQVDTSTNVGLRAEYNITRDIVLKASAIRTVYLSNVPNTNYNANVFLVGLKLQR